MTERIRVGSGGVMLPHYSPLKVAETFSILAGLHADRIDLGIGRAPGSDRETMFALQRDRRQISPDDFPEQLAELLAYVEDDFPADHFRSLGLRRCRAHRAGPRCGCSARPRRARSGPGSSACPTRSPTSSIPTAPRTRSSTASASSRRRGDRAPEVSVCVSAICADTEEEAERLASSTRMAITLLRRGQLIAVPSVEKALAFFEQPGESVAAGSRRVVVGTPESVRAGLEAVAEEYGAEEVLVVTITHDHDARRRSYELIAGAFELTR